MRAIIALVATLGPACNASHGVPGDGAACVYPPPDMGFAGNPCCPAMEPLGQCWSGAYCNANGYCCWRRDSGRHCSADGDCCSGHCATDGLCTACIDSGGGCSATEPCCSGTCANGLCR